MRNAVRKSPQQAQAHKQSGKKLEQDFGGQSEAHEA